MKIELKIMHENCYPEYATPGSAGIDLKAASLGHKAAIEAFNDWQKMLDK